MIKDFMIYQNNSNIEWTILWGKFSLCKGRTNFSQLIEEALSSNYDINVTVLL